MIYLDCSSGISGDMFAAAIISLGADGKRIQKALRRTAKVTITKTSRKGVKALKFDTEFKPDSREYVDLVKTIKKMKLPPKAQKLALKILDILAEAESEAHDVPISKVHLHEAADCVVDAAACAIAIDELGLHEERFVSSIVSCGYIAPATMHILRKYGIAVKFSSDRELVTPTGAAILAALVSEYKQMECHWIAAGAGIMDLPWPNVLGIAQVREKCIIESNIDDCTPEHISHMMHALMLDGALDVHVLPCMMKKGRIGFLVRVLTESPREHAAIIRAETGSLGVRVVPIEERYETPRSTRRVSVRLKGKTHSIRVKCNPAGSKPEFDDVSSLAMKHGMTYRKVRRLTECALKRKTA